MSLFEAAVAQVVKDVGDKSLVPVADRNSSDYCIILSVVERKSSFWHLPWHSSDTYIATEVGLNDLLVEPIKVDKLVTTTVLFENYTSTPSFHKDGKIGVKIAEEFNVDISVDETMQVSLKLGNVMKKEIPWQVLYDTLNNKKIKLDHPLIKVVKKSKQRSLFVVNMIVTSGSESSLDEDKEANDSVDLGVEAAQVAPVVALTLNISGESDSKQHRQYAIPLGTSFGYCCVQMKIDKNGVLNIQLAEDVVDAPTESFCNDGN